MMTSTHHFLLFANLILVGLCTSLGVNGYVYSSGPFRRNPCKPKKSSHSNSIDDDCFRVNDDFVDEAFSELQNEFGRTRRRQAEGEGKFDWLVSMLDSLEDSNDVFRSTVVDKRKAKKWIEKAFDLAFEFNEDFGAAEGEKNTTNESLKNSRDWVARFYEEDDDKQEETKATKNNSNGEASSLNAPSTSDFGKKQQANPPDKTNQIVSAETPDSEDRSDMDIFCVSIDLPGVEKTNVDITVDGHHLLIRAKRNASSEGLPIRIYTTKLAFPEDDIDMENLEANLKNGVLIVSAPKQKFTKNKRKIPVL